MAQKYSISLFALSITYPMPEIQAQLYSLIIILIFLMQKLNSKAFYLKNFLYKKRTITEPTQDRKSEMASPNRPNVQTKLGLNRRKEGKYAWPSVSPYNARNRKYSYDSKALNSQNTKEGDSPTFLKAGDTKGSIEKLSRWQSIFLKNEKTPKCFDQFPTISIQLSLIKPKRHIENTITPTVHSRLPTRSNRRISTDNTSQLKLQNPKDACQVSNSRISYQVHNACRSNTPKKKTTLNRLAS